MYSKAESNIISLQKEASAYQLKYYKYNSDMNEQKTKFICYLIEKYKPEKILEIGVGTGGTTLNLIKNFPDIKINSFDIKKGFTNGASSFGVCCTCFENTTAEERKNHNLFTGMLTDFLPQFKDTDFIIIDIYPYLPNEFLEFLLLLPYIKKDACIVLDNIDFLNFRGQENTICESFVKFHNRERFYKNREQTIYSATLLFFSAPSATKFILYDTTQPIAEPYSEQVDFFYHNNIGCFLADEMLEQNISNIFGLLNLPWEFIPPNIEVIKTHINNIYGDRLGNIFTDIVEKQKAMIKLKKCISENIQFKFDKDIEYTLSASL